MAKEQKWTVTVDGTDHTVTYVQGGLRSSAATLFVDEEDGKLLWPRDGYVDEPLPIGGTVCRFVMRNYLPDIVVNDTFLTSGQAYSPITQLPQWCRMVGAACLLITVLSWRHRIWIGLLLCFTMWLLGDKISHKAAVPLSKKQPQYLLTAILPAVISLLLSFLLP